MRTINIKVDSYSQFYDYRECMQYDDLTLKITLTQNGIAYDLTGCTLALNWIKADNTIAIVGNNLITHSSNVVTVALPRDCTRAPGIARFQLVVTNSTSKQETTFPLSIEVIQNVLQNQEESGNIATIIEGLIIANNTATVTYNNLINAINTGDLETIIRYPVADGEVGVINVQYPYGDVRRYGVFPNVDTIWHNTTYIRDALINASNLGFELFFPTGLYKTQLNISQSNVTIRFEEGAELTGLVHVFVEDNKEKIKNLTIKGTIVTYDRFGTRNIDGLTVDAIHVKSDGSKATDYPGVRGRGVHLSPGTTNFYCQTMTVDDCDGAGHNNVAAVEIDGSSNNPSNLFIEKIWVKKSDVHGVYIAANDFNIGEIRVNEFGATSYQIAVAMEDTNGLAQSQELKGVWLNRCRNSTVGKIIVNNANATRTNVKYDVLLDETGKTTDSTPSGVTIGEIISYPKGTSRGVSINDKNYVAPNCNYDIGTITVNNTSGRAYESGYALVSIEDYAKTTIKNIKVINADVLAPLRIVSRYINSINNIDLGNTSRQAYVNGLVYIDNLYLNRVANLDNLASFQMDSLASKSKINKLHLDCKVQLECNALNLTSTSYTDFGYINTGLHSGNAVVSLYGMQYTKIDYLRSEGVSGNRIGTALSLNGSLVNININNATFVFFATGINASTAVFTRCSFMNCMSASNTVATNIAAGAVAVFNCTGITL
jgi:hypothetical protein